MLVDLCTIQKLLTMLEIPNYPSDFSTAWKTLRTVAEIYIRHEMKVMIID